jgi:hypothetical protein
LSLNPFARRDPFRFGSGGGGTPFDPLTLSPRLAVEADGTLWQEDTRTTPATADDTLVCAWDDASGNAFHLLQNTSVNGGTLKTGILNGKPVIRFGVGVSNYLAGPAISNLISASAYTLYLMFKATTIDTNSANSYDNDGVVTDIGGFFGVHLKSAPTVETYNFASADDKVSLAINTSGFFWLMARHEGGNLYASINGGGESSVASGNTAALTNVLNVGRAQGGHYFVGDIAAIYIFNTAHNAGQIAQMEGYRLAKWGSL